MPWVVVIKECKHFGQVGLATRDYWLSGNTKVEVQFGSSGPVKAFKKSSLLSVSHIVKQVEANTGCNYEHGDHE